MWTSGCNHDTLSTNEYLLCKDKPNLLEIEASIHRSLRPFCREPVHLQLLVGCGRGLQVSHAALEECASSDNAFGTERTTERRRVRKSTPRPLQAHDLQRKSLSALSNRELRGLQSKATQHDTDLFTGTINEALDFDCLTNRVLCKLL